MRSFGFVLVIIGATVAYLGWNRKLGAAWSALLTGQVPSDTGSTSAVPGGSSKMTVSDGKTTTSAIPGTPYYGTNNNPIFGPGTTYVK